MSHISKEKKMEQQSPTEYNLYLVIVCPIGAIKQFGLLFGLHVSFEHNQVLTPNTNAYRTHLMKMITILTIIYSMNRCVFLAHLFSSLRLIQLSGTNIKCVFFLFLVRFSTSHSSKKN